MCTFAPCFEKKRCKISIKFFNKQTKLNKFFFMKCFVFEESLWREIDGKWRCIERTIHTAGEPDCNELPSCVLADYMLNLGFSVPENCSYCLCETSQYKMKYRNTGGLIHLFIKPNKWI